MSKADDETLRRILETLHRLEAEVGVVKAQLTGLIGVQDQIWTALAMLGIGADIDNLSGEPVDAPSDLAAMFGLGKPRNPPTGP